MAKQLVFLKTEWMEFYDGRKGDKAPGKFKFVKKTGKAHEDFNFKRQGDYVYAYAPIAGGGSGLNLKRLGAPEGTEYLDGVDVIFIASGDNGRGVVVVGWYPNARVYAHLQHRDRRYYLARGNARSAKLLEIDQRWLRITDPPRRSNVWYADGRPDVVAKVRRLMAGGGAVKPTTQSKHRDVDRCIAVEKAAYEAVIRKYESMDFVVRAVWKDKVGWDLEADRDGRKLHIEVKGTEHSEIRPELTPNEYTKSNIVSYRICLVTGVLSAKPSVHTFKRNFQGIWNDETGRRELLFEERIGARLSVGIIPL